MAKKVVVQDETEDNGSVKKRRGKCCSCCVAFLIFLVVILAAAFGVGWYFGDKFTQSQLGMSLADTFGVVNNLYWANDKKVVKHGYKAEDREQLYTQIKRNILLKDDTKIDFDAALEKAIDKYIEQMSAPQAKPNVAVPLADEAIDEDTDEGGETGADSNAIMDIFADMLADVLNRDNIDRDRLNAYPEKDEYILELNDRALAAFIGFALDCVLENADKIDAIPPDLTQMVKLDRVVALKQIEFKVKSNADISYTAADITVWIGLQDAAGQALTYFANNNGFGWASGLARWLGNVILPKNLYATVSLPLDSDVPPTIGINGMNEKERERAYKLINAVMKLSGSEQTLDGMLSDAANGFRPQLEAAASNMDFAAVPESGVIKLDLLEAATKAVSDGMGEPFGKSDFLYMLQALYSDPEVQLKKFEPYRYTDRYSVDGKEVYMPEGIPGQTPIDYEQKFIAEIEDKYSLDFGEDTKLADVLALFGISLGGGQSDGSDKKNLLELIDAEKFNAALDKDISELELTVTDRMLAAALATQTDALLSGFPDMKVTLDALTFIKKQNSDNLYAQIVAELDLGDMLYGAFGEENLMARIASGLMPERMLVTATIDITKNRPADSIPDKTEFVINSCDNTDRVLDIVQRLVPSLDIAGVTEQIETTLRDMLDQMYKLLNIRLVASTVEYDEQNGYTGETGALVLPDIFTVVVDTVLKDDNGRVVEPSTLKDIVRGLNRTDDVVIGTPIANGYDAFIADVVDKYYLAPDKTLKTLDDITTFMTAFDTSKFRITGNDPNVKYLAYDNRPIDGLRPIMTAPELGALLAEQSNEEIAEYSIKSVDTGEDTLTVVLAVKVSDLLPDDVKFLVMLEELYVTATIRLNTVEGEGTPSDPYRYAVDVVLNSMDAPTYAATLDVMKFFMPDFDVQAEMNEFGKIMYEQMQTVNKSFASAVDTSSAVQSNFFKFTEEGLVFDDFYTFLASKMSLALDTDTTPVALRSALQSVYARSSVAALENAANYKASDFVLNKKVGQTAWDSGKLPDSGKAYSDTEFNGYLKRAIEGKAGSVTVEQTAVLKANATESAALRTFVNDRLTAPLAVSQDYLLVTFAMDMTDFMSSSKQQASGFFPQKVYATAVYGYDGAAFAEVGIILNGMTQAEYNILEQFMGLSAGADGDGVDIDKVSAMTTGAFDTLLKLGDITLGGRANGEGMGSISFTARA